MRKRDGREGGDGQSRDGGKHASLLLVMQCHPPSQFCIFVFFVVLVCPFVVLYFCLYVSFMHFLSILSFFFVFLEGGMVRPHGEKHASLLVVMQCYPPLIRSAEK